MPNKPKIAIVGIGRWGKNLLRVFNDISDIALCVHSGKAENESWLRENYPKIPHSTNFKDILKDKTIEAVIIATPIQTHYKLVTEVLEAGKHVFVEKPLSPNLEESKSATALAKEKKKVLFVGYTFLFHPLFQKLKKELAGSTPTFADFHWSKFGTFDEDMRPNLMPHELSIMIELLGAPKSGRVLATEGIFTKEDILATEFTFKDGARAISYMTRVAPAKHKRVTISDGISIYTWQNDELYRAKSGKVECIHKGEIGEPLLLECKYFIECVKSGSSKVHPDGAFSTEVTEAISFL